MTVIDCYSFIKKKQIKSVFVEERSRAAVVFSYNFVPQADEDSGRALIISAFSASRKSFTSFAVMFKEATVSKVVVGSVLSTGCEKDESFQSLFSNELAPVFNTGFPYLSMLSY